MKRPWLWGLFGLALTALLVGVLSQRMVRPQPVGLPQAQHGSTGPADREWSAEEIARDPAAYLLWSDQRIAEQIKQREARLSALAERRTELEGRREKLKSTLADVANVRRRMETAYQRAEDEDRWPVQMGGKSFERAKARAILDQTQQYLDERKPLSEAYDAALKKMADAAAALRSDISKLGRLRERMALDLERVRLNQGMEELDGLRKSEAELDTMSETLSAMGSDTIDLSNLPADNEAEQIDIDALLR